jgi:dissimilatory sulfite reductase (desulfoviridin) alpha/beta subunit
MTARIDDTARRFELIEAIAVGSDVIEIRDLVGAWLFALCESPCRDCGVDTFAIREYFMVHDELWDSLVPERVGYLCIGCLEECIGRRLVPADFTHAPINAPAPGDSDRLTDRRGDPPEASAARAEYMARRPLAEVPA